MISKFFTFISGCKPIEEKKDISPVLLGLEDYGFIYNNRRGHRFGKKYELGNVFVLETGISYHFTFYYNKTVDESFKNEYYNYILLYQSIALLLRLEFLIKHPNQKKVTSSYYDEEKVITLKIQKETNQTKDINDFADEFYNIISEMLLSRKEIDRELLSLESCGYTYNDTKKYICREYENAFIILRNASRNYYELIIKFDSSLKKLFELKRIQHDADEFVKEFSKKYYQTKELIYLYHDFNFPMFCFHVRKDNVKKNDLGYFFYNEICLMLYSDEKIRKTRK